MGTLFTIMAAIQVCMALIIIVLVLLQHGKGADMGAAFGSGASGSLFGATGSSNFLSKSTGIAATIFFLVTLALTYLGNSRTVVSGGVMDNLSTPQEVIKSTKANNAADGGAVANQSSPSSSSQSDQIPH